MQRSFLFALDGAITRMPAASVLSIGTATHVIVPSVVVPPGVVFHTGSVEPVTPPPLVKNMRLLKTVGFIDE